MNRLTRYLYATALTAMIGAFASFMFAVLTGILTGAGVGLVLFGFAAVMTAAAYAAWQVTPAEPYQPAASEDDTAPRRPQFFRHPGQPEE